MLRRIALVATLAGGLPVSAAVDAADVVAEPNEVITFERHCATEQPYRVQAYGRFATTSEPVTAEALVLVLAGHAGLLRDNPVIGVGLQAMRIRGLAGWADEPFSMALVVADGSNTAIGASVDTYYESAPGGAAGVTFRMDRTGNYDWLSFLEPGEAPADDTEKTPYRFPPELYISHTHFADSDWSEPMRLSLILENEDEREQVTLVGPHLIAPADIMDAPAPEGRVLGLLAALNPLDEGGLFQWLRRAVKYRKCIDERRAAKRGFADRASVAPSTPQAVAL